MHLVEIKVTITRRRVGKRSISSSIDSIRVQQLRADRVEHESIANDVWMMKTMNHPLISTTNGMCWHRGVAESEKFPKAEGREVGDLVGEFSVVVGGRMIKGVVLSQDPVQNQPMEEQDLSSRL